jgi:AAA domain
MDLTELPCFPYAKVTEIAPPQPHAWLIENIWSRSACGLIGGQPKCCKSWLGLDMAISVASGTPCLGRFPVLEAGPALVFMAEDRLEDTRERLTQIAEARGISLDSLNLYMITAASIRLDHENDRRSLIATIAQIRPKLLLLDPFVRLHHIDENSAKEVSFLLGFLRHLERTYGVAIVLTHHTSKKKRSRTGQMLRGSGDLHAFGDSNIYLSRCDATIEMTLEHRTAHSLGPLSLELAIVPHVHLRIKDSSGEVRPEKRELSLEERIMEVLKTSSDSISREEMRKLLHVNNAKLGHALQHLKEKKAIVSDSSGIYLPDRHSKQQNLGGG